jgi:membrane associated rhomboid family serine protease
MNPGALRHHFAQLRRVRAVFLVVAVLVALHGVSLMLPVDGRNAWIKTLGLRRESWLGGGFWQIFSYGFVHGGWVHLAFNATGVLLLGMRIEWFLGAGGFLKVCGFGIVAGGALHLAAAPAGVDAPILVGFSGAVVALLLLLTTLSPESRMWPLPVSGRALGLGILLAEGFLALIDPALGLPGFAAIGAWVSALGAASWFDIAHACHFGGGLAGWLYGRWVLRPRVSMKSLRRARERGEAD